MKLTITEVVRAEIPDQEAYDYDGDIEPTPWEPSEGEEVRLRMEERRCAYFAGEWSMVGICAVAKTLYVGDDGYGVVGPEIRTPGVWMVESDAGEEYFDQIYHDELSTLREMLKAMGFSDDDINQHLDKEHKEQASA